MLLVRQYPSGERRGGQDRREKKNVCFLFKNFKNESFFLDALLVYLMTTPRHRYNTDCYYSDFSVRWKNQNGRDNICHSEWQGSIQKAQLKMKDTANTLTLPHFVILIPTNRGPLCVEIHGW